jgi:TonB family protein
MRYLLPLALLLITLNGFAQEKVYSTPKREFSVSDSIYTNYQVGPQFPGGEKALMLYLGENIQYPQEAQKNKIEGQVMARIVVHSNGKISNVELLRRLGYGCDEEVVRVLSSMPDWKPAEVNGKKAPVYYLFPVTFSLNESDSTIPE